MKVCILTLLMMLVVITGCESTEPMLESSEAATYVNIEQIELARTKPVKKSRCGMSPPVFDKQKIQAMLIKSGKIDINATQEQKRQQVKQFIANKQLAFAKKCRS